MSLLFLNQCLTLHASWFSSNMVSPPPKKKTKDASELNQQEQNWCSSALDMGCILFFFFFNLQNTEK